MRALPFSGLMGFQFVLFGWLVKHAVSFVGHSRHCSFSRHASPSGWEVKHQQDYQHRHEVSRRAATTNTEESTSSSSTEETLFDLLTSPETKQLLSMPGCSVVDVTLEDHRPLGCVVEESLASPPWTTLSKTPNSALPLVLKPKDGSNSGNTLVFVATVHAGGAAALSGIRPGDVICGVSSVMDSALLQDVTGSGMDVVKSLVANCPDSEPLRLQLVRGTSVLVDHEAVLTELCANPDTSDAETEQCVLDYLQGGYESLDDDATTTTIDSRSSSINGDMPTNGGGVLLVDTNGDTQNISADDDTERNLALDNLHSLWAEDFSSTVQSASLSTQSESSPSSSVVNPKPWSSRSSPSGTFVRDPGTGRMRNID